MRGQRHAPAAFYRRERPGTHCTVAQSVGKVIALLFETAALEGDSVLFTPELEAMWNGTVAMLLRL